MFAYHYICGRIKFRQAEGAHYFAAYYARLMTKRQKP